MSKVENNTFNNDWYSPGKHPLICILWYFVNVCFFINPLNPSSRLKVILLRLFGAKIEHGVVLKPNINIKYPWKLKIGAHTWIGEKVWIDNLTNVHIDNNCCISQGAMLLTGNHNYKKSSFDLMLGKITLEEGVWIGAQSIVCPGITCQTHAVLAVNSVATSDLESYTIYQGNPAQKTKKRQIES